jgi:hypothetical protein
MDDGTAAVLGDLPNRFPPMAVLDGRQQQLSPLQVLNDERAVPSFTDTVALQALRRGSRHRLSMPGTGSATTRCTLSRGRTSADGQRGRDPYARGSGPAPTASRAPYGAEICPTTSSATSLPTSERPPSGARVRTGGGCSVQSGGPAPRMGTSEQSPGSTSHRRRPWRPPVPTLTRALRWRRAGRVLSARSRRRVGGRQAARAGSGPSRS